MALRLEGRFPSNQLIKSNPNRPNINFLIIPATNKNLGSLIIQSPSNSKHLFLITPILNILTNAKIHNFNILIESIIENIIRFDIPMADITRMYIGNCIEKLIDNKFDFFDFEIFVFE